MPEMSAEQRNRFVKDAVGKTIESVEWVDDEAYWVFVFTDETEICVRLMTELV